jgi:hypothetical protein
MYRQFFEPLPGTCSTHGSIHLEWFCANWRLRRGRHHQTKFCPFLVNRVMSYGRVSGRPACGVPAYNFWNSPIWGLGENKGLICTLRTTSDAPLQGEVA